MPYLDWRPDICTSIHYNVRVCVRTCVKNTHWDWTDNNTHCSVDESTSSTHLNSAGHAGSPQLLDCEDTFSGFLHRRHRCSANTQTHAHGAHSTRDNRLLEEQDTADRTSRLPPQLVLTPVFCGLCRVVYLPPADGTGEWAARCHLTLFFTKYILKGPMSIKWCEYLYFLLKIKINKTKLEPERERKIKSGYKLKALFSNWEIICFIICKWTHKKNQTSTEIITVGGVGRIKSLHYHYTIQWDTCSTALLRTTWVLSFSFLNTSQPLFFPCSFLKSIQSFKSRSMTSHTWLCFVLSC